MKKILLLLVMLLMGMVVNAQECYAPTRSKGINLYNKGKYSEALKLFEAAKSCPDKPANDDLATWISKCKKSPTPVVNAADKVTIEGLDFADANGLVPVACYSDNVSTMCVKVIADNTAKSNNKLKLDLVIIAPDGTRILGKHSKKGVTESKEVTLKPGYNTVMFNRLDSYANSFETGVYTIELYAGKTKLKSTETEVYKRPTYIIVDGNKSSFTRDISCNKGSDSFVVQTNAKSFYIKHKPSWVTVEESTNFQSFSIMFEENPSHKPRSGSFDVYTDDGEAWVVIELVQEGNPAYARKLGDRMFKDMRMKFGVDVGLATFRATSSSPLCSVIDYGVTDMPSMAYLEEPDFSTKGGFQASFSVDLPLNDKFYIETGAAFQHFGVKNTFNNDKLTYTSGGVTYYMDYGCVENYSMNYLNIPVLGGYRLKLNSVSSLRFTAGLVFGLGISAKCKLTNGYSNFTYYPDRYANSSYSGEVNLFSGYYSIEQDYSTGSSSTFSYTGYKAKPFKRGNVGFNLSAAYDFGSFELGMSYVIGMSNIANRMYFESGDRVGGCLLVGEPIPSRESIYGYSLHTNYFRVFANVWL